MGQKGFFDLAVCTAASWPMPATVGSRSTATRFTSGEISLSSSSHFDADTVLEQNKPSGIAAWPREAGDPLS
jgi:hypothetical protein